MSATLARAAELVDQLVAAGVPTYTDPKAALNNRPCVLIGPPRQVFDLPHPHRSTTWTFTALSSQPLGGLESWTELDALVDLIVDQLEVDEAVPVRYALDDAANPIPSYQLTYTEAT